MHNTAMVDGKDQYKIIENELFKYGSVAHVRLNKWETNQYFDFFDGEHYGYNSLANPVIHRRAIKFDKTKLNWEVTDFFNGNGEHDIAIYFHFNKGINFDIFDNNHAITNLKNKKNLRIDFESQEKITLSKENCWVSTSYGNKESSFVLKIKIKMQYPVKVKSVISLVD